MVKTINVYDGLSRRVEKRTYGSGSPLLSTTRYLYDGTVLTASAYGNRYLYAGREYEATTALYHYRNREYCPALGRFLQPDPIGHAGDASNLYRFCGNNPVSNGDPSGLDDADGGNFSAGGSGDYGGITTGNSGGSGFGSSGVTISLGSDDPGLPGFSNLSGSFSGGFSDIGIPTESQNNVSLPHVSSTGLDAWNTSVNHLAFTPILGTPASPASGAASVAPGASSASISKTGPTAQQNRGHWKPCGVDNTPYLKILLGFEAVPVAIFAWELLPASTEAISGLRYAQAALQNGNRIAYVFNPATGALAFAATHNDAWDALGLDSMEMLESGGVFGEYFGGNPITYQGEGQAAMDASAAVIKALEPY